MSPRWWVNATAEGYVIVTADTADEALQSARDTLPALIDFTIDSITYHEDGVGTLDATVSS